MRLPPDVQGQVSAAAEEAGLGRSAGEEMVLSGGKQALEGLFAIAIGVLPSLMAVRFLVDILAGELPGWGAELFFGVIFVFLGPAIVYMGFRDLVRAHRDKADVYFFEHGLVAIDVRGRLRVFPWQTIRVHKDITELKQYSFEKTPYHRRHVYTLIRPDGESLRLDSYMCKDVIAFGPRIAAAANFEQDSSTVSSSPDIPDRGDPGTAAEFGSEEVFHAAAWRGGATLTLSPFGAVLQEGNTRIPIAWSDVDRISNDYLMVHPGGAHWFSLGSGPASRLQRNREVALIGLVRVSANTGARVGLFLSHFETDWESGRIGQWVQAYRPS